VPFLFLSDGEPASSPPVFDTLVFLFLRMETIFVNHRFAIIDSPMKLVYDSNDLENAKKLKDDRFVWLRELGAVELHGLQPDDQGFLFSYEYGEAHLAKQVGDLPGIHDRPSERSGLINLDEVLSTLTEAGVDVPTPKTWVIGIDETMPSDLSFPLFLRTPRSSWKRGSDQGKVSSLKELNDEAELLRRAFGWDTPIIAREWLDIAPAGRWMFGDAPQEIRTWVFAGTPVAWSFHYLHAVPSPHWLPSFCQGSHANRDNGETGSQSFRITSHCCGLHSRFQRQMALYGSWSRSGRRYRSRKSIQACCSDVERRAVEHYRRRCGWPILTDHVAS
jgi:hypothetical protein